MSELGFRIEASSKAFEILANNLYKDKTLAVIRELCCNAYDAQVEAGNETTPFEVHLPTRFETYFSVRDFGNGLSSDQIEEIFTVFFASTKTGSSAFTGSFGLGAKTPFAIVNEFYVNSYQNKTLTKYVCKKKDGFPVIECLGVQPTEAPNGLEIKLDLPTKDFSESNWQDKAQSVFDAFRIAPKCNIVLWLTAEHERYQCGNNWEILPNNHFVCIQMGNVRYPLSIDMVPKFQEKNKKSFNSTIYAKDGLCIHVPQKSIEITPSREEISYDEKTVAFLENYLQKTVDDYESHILNEINECAYFGSVIKLFTDKYFKNERNLLWDALDKRNLHYKGKPVLNSLQELSINLKQRAIDICPVTYSVDAPPVHFGTAITIYHDSNRGSFKTKSSDVISTRHDDLTIPKTDENRKPMKTVFVVKDVQCDNTRGARLVALSLCEQNRNIKIIMLEDPDAFSDIADFDRDEFLNLSNFYTDHSKRCLTGPVRKIPKKDLRFYYKKINVSSLDQTSSNLGSNIKEIVEDIIKKNPDETIRYLTTQELINKSGLPNSFINPHNPGKYDRLDMIEHIKPIYDDKIDNINILLFRNTNLTKKVLCELRKCKTVVNFYTETREKYIKYITTDFYFSLIVKMFKLQKILENLNGHNASNILDFICTGVIFGHVKHNEEYKVITNALKCMLFEKQEYANDPKIKEFNRMFCETFGISFENFTQHMNRVDIQTKHRWYKDDTLSKKFPLPENTYDDNLWGKHFDLDKLKEFEKFFVAFIIHIYHKYKIIVCPREPDSNIRSTLARLIANGKIKIEDTVEEGTVE
jgi:hypothetical protein